MTYHGTIICSTCDGEGIYQYNVFEPDENFGYFVSKTTFDKCPTCEGSGLLEVYHKPKKFPVEYKIK